MLTEGGATPDERIGFAFRAVLSRLPDAEEVQIVRGQLDAHLARYAADEESARKLITQGESQPRPDLPPAEVAAILGKTEDGVKKLQARGLANLRRLLTTPTAMPAPASARPIGMPAHAQYAVA